MQCLAKEVMSEAEQSLAHSQTPVSASQPPPKLGPEICVSYVNSAGGQIPIEPPMVGDELVHELRSHVAATMRYGTKQVKLLRGVEDLKDPQTLAEAVSGSEDLEISVVILQADDLYRDYIVHASNAKDRNFHHDRGRGYHGGRPEEHMPMDPLRQAYVKVATGIEFPPPQGVNINMMPFIMGDKSSIPEEFRGYWPIIEKCWTQRGENEMDRFARKLHGRDYNNPTKEHGKVWYLTIHESITPAGQSQRRGGVHIDAEGVTMTEGGRYRKTFHAWGMSMENFDGGIYMASNVSSSTKLWNVTIKDHPEVVGPHGDLEHIRHLLPEGQSVGADELIWLHDTTPHESLPFEKDSHRQFIRVVTSSVSAWYEKHSTKNPLGIVPAPFTKILTHHKFGSTRSADTA